MDTGCIVLPASSPPFRVPWPALVNPGRRLRLPRAISLPPLWGFGVSGVGRLKLCWWEGAGVVLVGVSGNAVGRRVEGTKVGERKAGILFDHFERSVVHSRRQCEWCSHHATVTRMTAARVPSSHGARWAEVAPNMPRAAMATRCDHGVEPEMAFLKRTLPNR